MGNIRYAHAAVLAFLVLFVPGLALAADPFPKTPLVTGKKKLLLFAKNPATWKIVKGGASGKMVYHAASGQFTLQASGLNPDSAYTLVRYADEPPKVEILATGKSDRKGALQLAGNWRNWTKKFWLAPAEDVSGNKGAGATLTAWRPERYLFEEKPLGIPCNCPEPDEP